MDLSFWHPEPALSLDHWNVYCKDLETAASLLLAVVASAEQKGRLDRGNRVCDGGVFPRRR